MAPPRTSSCGCGGWTGLPSAAQQAGALSPTQGRPHWPRPRRPPPLPPTLHHGPHIHPARPGASRPPPSSSLTLQLATPGQPGLLLSCLALPPHHPPMLQPSPLSPTVSLGAVGGQQPQLPSRRAPTLVPDPAPPGSGALGQAPSDCDWFALCKKVGCGALLPLPHLLSPGDCNPPEVSRTPS